MFWERKKILKSVATERVQVVPFADACCKSHSYVLRLGSLWNCWPQAGSRQQLDIDPFRLDLFRKMTKKQVRDKLTVLPFSLVLNGSLETVRLPDNVAGFLTPLGQLSRMGIVNFSSPYLHPGFGGARGLPVVFEFFHILPCRLRLHAGMPFAHLHFFSVPRVKGQGESPAHGELLKGSFGSIYDKLASYRKVMVMGVKQASVQKRSR